MDEQSGLETLLTLLTNSSIDQYFLMGSMAMLLLLILSGLVSGSEVAYFSLSPADLEELESASDNSSKTVLHLLEKPKRLLATILIANNFINVSIVVLSTVLTDKLFYMITDPVALFFIQVLLVTFLILLMGEVIPKIYANTHQKIMAKLMAYPILILVKVFKPLSLLLVNSTKIIDKRFKKKGHTISVSDLSHALELTTTEETSGNEQQILKGIVKFGNTDVKQIMKSRVNVSAFEYDIDYKTLLDKIVESGFSRIPIYKENFDTISGILYIKDLLPYLNNDAGFEWQKLLRPPIFVPENKKIDDLLKEFQRKKIHLAVVVDEYGGSSGIVTLEDIMEEIVGEISDEFDEEELVYSKLDEHNYVFEGKTALNDLYRVLNIDGDIFEQTKGESDTLAGFILELEGAFPAKGAEINFNIYTFKIESVDSRRIKTVKVTINNGDLDKNKQ
ncbi:MAG TPA: gliding motility-associated protein GldE [Bacteroidia bacterium]|nr:gliding motility-associated protein GldE [Bacteroidia bacterium]